MPTATLERTMANKKKPELPSSRPEASSETGRGRGGATLSVRVRADLAKMIDTIATETGVSAADLLDDVLRPFVKQRYADVIAERFRELNPDD